MLDTDWPCGQALKELCWTRRTGVSCASHLQVYTSTVASKWPLDRAPGITTMATAPKLTNCSHLLLTSLQTYCELVRCVGKADTAQGLLASLPDLIPSGASQKGRPVYPDKLAGIAAR